MARLPQWTLFCAATVVALLTAEGALRLFAPVPYSIERSMYFEADPHTGFRLKPHGIGRYQGSIAAIANGLGMRDDEVTVEKADGVRRVLVIGDSFTVGAGVEQADAYPQLLERRLAAPDLEVVNAGVGGWGPYQYRQFFEHRGGAFAPDLVLVGFFVGNDTYDPRQSFAKLPTAILGRRISRDAAASRWSGAKVLLTEHLHLGRLALTRSAPANRHIERRDCGDFSPQLLKIQRRRLRRNQRPPDAERRALMTANLDHLTALAESARRGGAQVLLVLIPDENQINPRLTTALPERAREGTDLDLPQALLRPALEARQLPYVDLLSAFRDDPRCLYLNDTHWNVAGHHLAAELLAAEVRARLR
ncbi:MAG: GDSL-type esterase/lipase family protein [Acidobacteriota bacterium]